MSELKLAALQDAVDQLCAKVTHLTHQNQQLKNELEGSENVRRLLVRKNKNLADQIKQMISELQHTSI